ncbi:unnamed protein product [Peronospora farinosa]|uniref:Uncharacterized protein n=1 Tax=Peronospora farinosa TaxID=134698 RepID=A0AAV0UBY2_9STRA|nr:unnamed protein product [Peronospora farinosa]
MNPTAILCTLCLPDFLPLVSVLKTNATFTTRLKHEAQNGLDFARLFSKQKDVEEVEDAAIADDFNELFSYVEQKGTKRVDINVIPDKNDDDNTSSTWTQLKTKTDSSIEKSGRGERVAMLLKIFLTLKNKESVESVEGSSTWDSLADCEDVENVELVADLFTALGRI